HGLISFVAMTEWFTHLLNLFLMSIYYSVLLYDVKRYVKMARYRFRALVAVIFAGAAFASPYLNSEFYGFEIESLSWCFNHSRT
ncbi:hypothetical protein PENTCL1PPCAC_910, partial [Pristionchus entomophagus]